MQYGAFPPTVARAAGVSLKVAKILFEANKQMNWSLEAIAKSHEVKRTSFGKYQKNLINGMYYHLKYDKDAVSTSIQGTGSYILDFGL